MSVVVPFLTKRYLRLHASVNRPLFVARSASSATAPASSSPKSERDVTLTASQHLFRLAELEEEEATLAPPPRQSSASRYINSLIEKDRIWTGDEAIEDTVLRMLVDKHKPLRSGSIRSSEEKIKDLNLQVDTTAFQMEVLERANTGGGTGGGTMNVPLSPVKNSKVFPGHLVGGNPDHKPWHSTYVTPKHHVTPLVKYGLHVHQPHHHSHSISPKSGPSTSSLEPKLRAEVKRKRSLEAGVGRIGRAKERVLDYTLGEMVGGATKSGSGSGDDMVVATGSGVGASDGAGGKLEVRVGAGGDDSMGVGWSNLVEQRIERARAEGAFDKLSGRGKPLVEHTDQKNPFIERTEFFMNRIVQRNDALPLWIEYQKDHTRILNHFRSHLVTTITSHLLRRTSTSFTQSPQIPTSDASSSLLRPGMTLNEVKSAVGWRDPVWEASHTKFWESMVEECNRAVRRADGATPPSARRGQTTLRAELSLAYSVAYERIHSLQLELEKNPLTDEQLYGKRRGTVATFEWPEWLTWKLLLPAAIRRWIWGAEKKEAML